MSTNKEKEQQPAPGYFFQRRVSAVVDHLRPHRWNWYTLVRPLDRTLAQQTAEPLPHDKIRSLRYF